MLKFNFLKFPFKSAFLNSFTKFTIARTKLSSFCTLTRLNFDKIKIEGGGAINNSSSIQYIMSTNDEEKEFKKEDHIIEFTPEVNWQETVLNSEIPVVVDCYAV